MARLPLFPLGTVLFPGVMLPLHIFEPRYRRLINDLLDQPDGERKFGVVGIRAGRETGLHSGTRLHDVGCTAELRRVEELPDGRFHVISTGVSRFRVMAVDNTEELVRADVAFLDEPRTDHADVLATQVAAMFLEYYRALLTAQRLTDFEEPEFPTDAVHLSYLVADSMLLDDSEKQQLLETDGADQRLELEITLLQRETAMIRGLAMRPAVELNHRHFSQN